MSTEVFESLKKSLEEAGKIVSGEITPSREFTVSIPEPGSYKREGFALCIKSDEPELLVPFKVYKARFSTNDYVGITDEEGEAAVYPGENFMRLDFPSDVERVLVGLVEAA